ncbi:extracellular solute-binding protein [Natrialba swarupiae]|nr:extracellular solute-binding protein [Natrialba swarupiae]
MGGVLGYGERRRHQHAGNGLPASVHDRDVPRYGSKRHRSRRLLRGGIEQIWDAVREQRELVTTYWSTGDEHVRLYAQNEALVGEAWGGRIYGAVQDGHDHLGYVVPEEGAYGWSDNWTIIDETSPERKAAAFAFLDYLLEDDTIQGLSEMLGYPGDDRHVRRDRRPLRLRPDGRRSTDLPRSGVQ